MSEAVRINTSLLPWYREQFAQLATLHARRHLGHAWLFNGLAGTGKLALALHFSRYLLCDSPANGEPCGECTGCRLFAAGTHPDFRLVQPEKKLITVDLIRDSIEFAQSTSQRGGGKVLVFEPAEAMNANAANALLKLLEEPPRTQLFLVSHQSGLLPATLRSRCQQLRCPLPERSLALAWLEARGLGAKAEGILRQAAGAPLRALALADPGAQAEWLDLMHCVQELMSGRLNPVEAARKCEKIGALTCIDYLLRCATELARACQGAVPPAASGLEELASRLCQGGKGMSLRLHALYRELQQARKVLLATNNANGQLVLEGLFASVAATGAAAGYLREA